MVERLTALINAQRYMLLALIEFGNLNPNQLKIVSDCFGINENISSTLGITPISVKEMLDYAVRTMIELTELERLAKLK